MVTVTLEEYGIESTDPLHEDLEQLHQEAIELDDGIADRNRDPELARELANVKSSLVRAKEIRRAALRQGVDE